MAQKLQKIDQAPKESSSTSNGASPAMSSQQKRFSGSRLSTYKDFVIGTGSYLDLFLYELYSLFCAPLPGALGFALRSIFLPLVLKNAGKKLTVGKGVSIRQPGRTSLGKGVIIDDYAVLDVRSESGGSSTEKSSKELGIEISDFSVIGRGSTILAKGGKVILEPAVNIGSNCRIATQTKIKIGESTLIAAYTYIGPGNHTKAEGKELIESDMELKGGVEIGSNCWIGTRVTILDGVKIGDRATIGAHSLVKDDVPAGAVAVGCPAKIIS